MFWPLWTLDLVIYGSYIELMISFEIFWSHRKCAHIIGSKSEIDGHWNLLRKYQPKGPLVNSEFYPGWFTHWQEPLSKRDAKPVAESLR